MIDYVRSEDYDRRSGTPFHTEANNSSSGRPAVDGGVAAAKGGLSGRQSSRGGRGDDEGHDKVGMAVIFNEAPVEGEVPRWDYTLRLNYTYGISQLGEQVTNHKRGLVVF